MDQPWPSYSNYKPSGIQWLGDIPAHWQTRRLKFVAPPSTRKAAEKPVDAVYVGLENIEPHTGRLLLDNPIEQVDSAVGFFYTGDVLFGKLRPYLAKVVHAEFDGVCTSELLILHPQALIDARYLFHTLLSDGFIALVNSQTYGTKMPRANSEQLGDISVPLPPPPEQYAIAAFLDTENAKLDALISREHDKFELLNEKRAAIISQAVTRGIIPSVKLKDSGVLWFGQLPAHWEVVALRRAIDKFVDYRGHTPPKVPSGVLLITARNVKFGFLDLNDSQEFIAEELYDEWMVRGLPEVGDVVVTTEAPLGNVAQITDTNVALAQRLILLKADPRRLANAYLKYYFLAAVGQSELQRQATGSTAEGIKASKFKSIAICLPTLEEQNNITAYLDREIAKIDALASKVHDSIGKLREYRSALTVGAVTGKIDVRIKAEA